MAKDWRGQLKDESEKKVFEALADPKWDFRTVDGLSRATGLETEAVNEILEGHSDLVRKSYVPDNLGRDLYTLRMKERTTGEILKNLKTFLTKSTG